MKQIIRNFMRPNAEMIGISCAEFRKPGDTDRGATPSNLHQLWRMQDGAVILDGGEN